MKGWSAELYQQPTIPIVCAMKLIRETKISVVGEGVVCDDCTNVYLALWHVQGVNGQRVFTPNFSTAGQIGQISKIIFI